jgi:hypothetical protein
MESEIRPEGHHGGKPLGEDHKREAEEALKRCPWDREELRQYLSQREEVGTEERSEVGGRRLKGARRYLLSVNVERISIDLLISLKVGKSYEANDGKSEEVAFNCELQW